MKHFFISILLLISAITVAAQPPVDNLNKMNMNPQKIKPGILSDKINSQGERIVYGKAQFMANKPDEDAETIGFGFGKPIPTSITTQTFFKSGCYGITINMVRMKKRSVPDDAKVLIKTSSGTIIETNVLEGCEAEETFYPVVNISMTTQKYDEPRYKMFCHIKLDQDQFTLIKEEGIQKFRIQTDIDYYDIELKKDNVSQFYVNEFLEIEKLTKTGDFKDGF